MHARQKLGSPLLGPSNPALAGDAALHGLGLFFGAPSVFHHYAPGHSSPPGSANLTQTVATNHDSTQETVVDRAPSSPMLPHPDYDFIRPDPLGASWIPGTDAVEAVLHAAQLPQSPASAVQLQLMENWWGQAELSAQRTGDVLTSSIEDAVPQSWAALTAIRIIERDSKQELVYNKRTPSVGYERPSSAEVLVQRLKRRATELFCDAKRQKIGDADGGDYMLDTDALMTNSMLDLSDSPHLRSTFGAVTFDSTSDTENCGNAETSYTSQRSIYGLSSDCDVGSPISCNGVGQEQEQDSGEDPAVENDEDDTYEGIEAAETSSEASCIPDLSSPSDEDEVSPGPVFSVRPLKLAREQKLDAEQIELMLQEAAERLRTEPEPLGPEYLSLDGSHSRVDMLKSIAGGSARLNDPVRGKLKCHSMCDRTFTTPMKLAGHLDARHGADPRPFKCPYRHCEWWVLGFPSKSQCKRHIKHKHAELMNECAVCKRLGARHYEFSRLDALRRHLRILHGR